MILKRAMADDFLVLLFSYIAYPTIKAFIHGKNKG
jgi:hypothetical protein